MFKRILSYVLSTALIFESSMLWGQKPANPPHILYDSAKEYMKDTGLNKKNLTYNEWFKKAKKYLDPEVGGKIERWVKQNPNKKMPSFEIAKGKKTDDKIVLKVTAKQNGKSLSFDFVQTATDAYFIFQGRKYSHTDLYYGSLLDKVYGYSPLLSKHKLKSIAKTHPKTALKYIKSLRDYVVSYEQYQNVFLDKSKKVSFWEQFVPKSYAANTPCIVAGWPEGNLNSQNGVCTPPNFAKVTSCSTSQYYCNPAMFGTKVCAPKSPAAEVSRTCRTNSEGKLQDITNYLYDNDTTYSKLNSAIEASFNQVFNTCISDTHRDEYSQAMTKGDKTFFHNLDANLNATISTEVAGKCKNKNNCMEHNKIACQETMGRISDLLQQPIPKVADKPCENSASPTIPGGFENCATLPGDTSTARLLEKITPEAQQETVVADPSTDLAQADEESPGLLGSVGNFWSDNKWFRGLTYGLVGFGAGFLLCRFWACKNAITKTNTNYVPVTGPTQFVPVPGLTEIQYLIPPAIPPPDPEEFEVPRLDGQGAR